MNIEQMYDTMYVHNCLIHKVGETIGNAKELIWDSVENQSAEKFMIEANKAFEDDETKNVVCGTWCYDKLSIRALCDIYEECNNKQIQTIFIPELLILILCKDKESCVNAFSKLDDTMKEMASINLKDINMTDTGIIFTYNTKVSYKVFEERPDFVYEIIENLRKANE